MCQLFKLKINRESFIEHCRDYINSHTTNPVGVEVGVLHGNFSFFILDTWTNIKLFSVDMWRQQNNTSYIDVANKNNEEFEKIYLDVLTKSKNYNNRSIIVRKSSLEAVDMFDNESLDFVYIDANHKYEDVKEDLEAWFPKVKPQGIISGHDFINDGIIHVDGVETAFGVQKAVKEFFNSKTIFHTDEAWSNWFVIKN